MTDIAGLLADPHFFLQRIDAAAGSATFLPARPELLARPSFLDGRTEFAAGPPVVVRLDDLLAATPPTAPGPNRYIPHVAFCGSTLLARLLEHPGHCFVLKEPHVLVDLADWTRAGADARFAPALRMALACLRRRWSAEEAVVVKPTNWVNNLLGDLASDPAGWRPLFVTMAPRAYAIAVLRGGRDRLTFAARTAAHLATSAPEGEQWLRSAIDATADPIGRAVNLSLVTLRLQDRLFAAQPGPSVDAELIFTDPAAASQRASTALDLGLDAALLARTATERTAINAKRPGHAFSADTREQEDEDVLRHHRATIDTALAWAKRALA